MAKMKVKVNVMKTKINMKGVERCTRRMQILTFKDVEKSLNFQWRQ